MLYYLLLWVLVVVQGKSVVYLPSSAFASAPDVVSSSSFSNYLAELVGLPAQVTAEAVPAVDAFSKRSAVVSLHIAADEHASFPLLSASALSRPLSSGRASAQHVFDVSSSLLASRGVRFALSSSASSLACPHDDLCEAASFRADAFSSPLRALPAHALGSARDLLAPGARAVLASFGVEASPAADDADAALLSLDGGAAARVSLRDGALAVAAAALRLAERAADAADPLHALLRDDAPDVVVVEVDVRGQPREVLRAVEAACVHLARGVGGALVAVVGEQAEAVAASGGWPDAYGSGPPDAYQFSDVEAFQLWFWTSLILVAVLVLTVSPMFGVYQAPGETFWGIDFDEQRLVGPKIRP